ncbi:DUF262 domain-containing protein [Caballeronia sp. LZ028]|uniref:DUF262 domain-containing protein n=1 Tax=Caballeronia sp. LZ028 TaxID=3038563 RepID=UPI00285F4689|nr:DUF262 domain-containing protein [Caballeronia sp. LZ028]MDR5769726.1 DUF262 domain-containing protein [Caballeronia sp. LZ028]
MRLVPWDPDVQTVMSRIESDALDLQPNFQRGEVWPRSKKQRLIDSVLREWHVPPIHVIENPTTRKQEVLDGQQRLVAIRDFIRGEISVDGEIEPLDFRIQHLDGLKYRTLPDDVRRQFDQFTLRIYRIIDYAPSEPAELFYRLNQPSNLTGAEQRNAFYGPVRDQIREFVLSLEKRGIGKDQLGFSNARMAYDDVICRVALTIRRGSIDTKITANDLVELYRSETPLDVHTLDLIRRTLDVLGSALDSAKKPKFNKATLYSWLVFIARALSSGAIQAGDAHTVSDFLTAFSNIAEDSTKSPPHSTYPQLPALMKVYEDRATSRVADVSSIVIRDLVIWTAFADVIARADRPNVLPHSFRGLIEKVLHSEVFEPDMLARHALESGWGKL